jgi:hypothetical protein
MKRIVLGTMTLALAMAAPFGPALALGYSNPPGIAEDDLYWDDFAHSHLIGEYRQYCDGHTSGWGSISEWNEFYYYDC